MFEIFEKQTHMNEPTTKERILSATTDLLHQKAMSDISIREIAAIAAVNIASINYYFSSKERLFSEALESITIHGHDEWVRANIDLENCRKDDLLKYVMFLHQSTVEHNTYARTRVLNLLASDELNVTNLKFFDTLYAIVKRLNARAPDRQLKIKVGLIFGSLSTLACSTREINAFLDTTMEDKAKLTQYVKSILKTLFP
jgi:AcrR family transcriptional regulator